MQPGLYQRQPSKSMRENFVPFISFTTPRPLGTKSTWAADRRGQAIQSNRRAAVHIKNHNT